ncbi:CotH kinase family protein [Nocardioides campestrisoli]|uniref:CotH kinase family protein n=1 Tax=Nocardioides campestrisoli TaxID=2736757 RepID=UPI0015E64313|nr:CotH kinase family protein [Nocardioides campestrisoli]
MRSQQGVSVRRAVGIVAILTAGALGPWAHGAAAAPRAPEPAAAEVADPGTWAVPARPERLVVDTEQAAPVVSKDDYVAGSLSLAGASYPIEIKGRGNSTWKWPKKPYKVKLAAPTSLGGMPAADEWVLLANYADRSALRNHLALQLGRQTRLAWTPDSRFVDLVLNGRSQGLYLLTEQVEQGPTRVALPEGGYLLEVDQRFRASGDPGFRTRRGTPVSFKDPDELERPESRRIKKAVNAFEDVLYGDRFTHPVRGYAPLVDVDSFVDWYVVQELFRNQDSNFHSSVHVSWTPGGRFTLGPLWDFDLSAGTKWNIETTPEGWHTRLGKHWIARMLQDPAFSTAVKQRTIQLAPVVEQLVAQIPAAAQAVRPEALADWQLWHVSHAAVVGSVHADDLDGEVEFLRTWLAGRLAWMTAPEVMFGRPSGSLREKDQVVQVPVRVLASDRAVTVDYAHVGGKATPGVDFTLVPGTLRFAPGETEKTFPVTIHGDAVPETAERVHLALRSPDGARLGDPQGLSLEIAASDQRPDAQVRVASRGRYAGVGVLHAKGRGQHVRTEVTRSGSRTVEMRVHNPGPAAAEYRLRGRGGGRALQVRWFRGKVDVTEELRSGLTVRVGARGNRPLRAVVRARPGARPGKAGTLRLTAVWRGEGRVVDTVRATVRVAR